MNASGKIFIFPSFIILAKRDENQRVELGSTLPICVFKKISKFQKFEKNSKLEIM